MKNGTVVYAAFDHCETDPRIQGRGQNPVYAVLRFDDGFRGEREFRSNSLMQNPTERLRGQLVPVYVDEDDPENYYVDLDSVL